MNTILNPIDENSVDYKKDKRVDIHNLHTEWLKQSELVGDYYKLRAQAENEVENIKRKIDIAKAFFDKAKPKLDLNIRKNQNSYDWDIKENGKLTEAIVNNLLQINIDKDEECIKTKKELDDLQVTLIEANKKYNFYYAATKAIVERKSTLENEVNLFLRNYFSSPNLPKDLSEYPNISENKKDETVNEVKQKVNRTRRGL